LYLYGQIFCKTQQYSRKEKPPQGAKELCLQVLSRYSSAIAISSAKSVVLGYVSLYSSSQTNSDTSWAVLSKKQNKVLLNEPMIDEFIALGRKLRTETITQMPILGGFLPRLRPIRCGYDYRSERDAHTTGIITREIQQAKGRGQKAKLCYTFVSVCLKVPNPTSIPLSRQIPTAHYLCFCREWMRLAGI
jgi:hypothetical protein